MQTKILLPMAIDLGISPQPLEVAEALCGAGGEIMDLHVYEAPQGSVSVYRDEEAVKVDHANTKARMKEKLSTIPKVTPFMVSGHAARSIIDDAAANDFDRKVIGSHKPGLSDYFVGSTAFRVLRHASCAVHVHREKN